MKDLLVISNDKIFFSKKNISSRFNDTINILDALQRKFNIFLLSRDSQIQENFNLKKKNIFKFYFKDIFILKKKKIRVFIISVTPRNIFFYLFLNIFFNNITGYIYLRSDGFKEYQAKFGKLGFIFFSILMKIIDGKLKTISVNKNIKSNNIDYLITPSELTRNWFKKKNKTNLNFARLLYFGRFKKEKGIFSLIRLLKNQKFRFRLTIAGDNNYINQNFKNIKFVKEISNQNKIINLYDEHNIFILPSYTEGSPKVILESLARKKPVIIFNDIKHVKSGFKGIFICERNTINLKNTINHILKNYSKIQKEMNKNKLMTKKIFQRKLTNILNV
tara:strand:+ start:801 stop:1799 length:999 start_codon:yes stop_codon:yes gene_type:complete